MRRTSTRLPVLLLLLLLVGSLAGSVASAASRATTTVRVTLGAPSEFAITASTKTVSAGTTTFSVTNKGTITHEVNILRVASPTTALPKGKTAGQVREKGKVGAVEGLRSGKRGTVTVNLDPGTYQLFCNIPGHYAAGMRTILKVS